MKDKHALLTADGLAAVSASALARLLGIHRNRISEMRSEGAPDGCALADWHTWLADHGRAVVAARLAEAIQARGDLPIATPATSDSRREPELDLSYKNRLACARAKLAELDLAKAEGSVVPREQLGEVVRRLSSLVSEALAPGLWPDLLPELAAAAPDLRKRLRAAHDAGLLRLRSSIAMAARTALAIASKERT